MDTLCVWDMSMATISRNRWLPGVIFLTLLTFSFLFQPVLCDSHAVDPEKESDHQEPHLADTNSEVREDEELPEDDIQVSEQQDDQMEQGKINMPHSSGETSEEGKEMISEILEGENWPSVDSQNTVDSETQESLTEPYPRGAEEVVDSSLEKLDRSDFHEQSVGDDEEHGDEPGLPPVTGPPPDEEWREREEGMEEASKELQEEKEKEKRKEEEPGEELYFEGVMLVSKYDKEKKARGYGLLLQAAELGNSKAKEELAYAYMFGNVLQRNFSRSFELFSELATDGDPAGQQGLGFMYSTGVGVNSNQAKAVIYYTFAALGGHHFARMTMGYHIANGNGVARSCEGALSYYYKAAKTVAMRVSLFTGGEAINKIRLMEEENEETSQYGVSESDMLYYQNVFADSGNTGAQLMLGMFYMHGMGQTERNFKLALKFLKQAAEEGVATANAFIGKIYAEGSEDVPQDTEAALEYFKKAVEQKNADGYCGMGMMYLYGMGVDQDYIKALEYFQFAAEKGSAEGQYFMGYLYLNGYGVARDLSKALRYFQLASHAGHLVAIYSLGEMHAEGLVAGRGNCNFAVELFKTVAERSKWSRLFIDAEMAFSSGDLDSAFVIYLLLAEMGHEIAQSNAAYLLEQESMTLVPKNETLKRALILWNRAAAQGYAEARVKLGDYHYYGHGAEVNYEAAASQYRIACEKQASAQAMFNLGYMYEQGLGLKKDYHLAKRYYDMAAETTSDALVPVNLALFKLKFMSYYDAYQEYVSMLGMTSLQLDTVLGPSWDLYLISLLAGALMLIILWRRR